jgi:hypothetical protein
MPVPLIKRRANLAGCLVSILTAGPPSQGAVSGPGQALQDDAIPDPAGRVGRVFISFFFQLLFFQWEDSPVMWWN